MADSVVGSVAVDVIPSTRTWNAKIRAQLLPQADKLGQDIGKRIGDNIRDRLRAELKDLPNARVKLNADTAEFDRKYDTVSARAAALGRRSETIRVKADTRDFDAAFAKITGKLALSGGSAKAIGVASLLPAVGGLASAAPIIGGLAASMTAAGIGTGAFAAVAVPAFKSVQKSSQALAKAQADLTKGQKQLDAATTKAQKTAANKAISKAQDEQRAALAKLDPAQKTAVTQYNAFTDAVHKFQKANDPAVLPAIGGGFKLITDQLPKFTPLVQGAAGAFTDLEKDAGKALNSPFWKNFASFVDKRGPESIQTYGKVAGNTVTGLFGIVQGFDPQIQTTEQGLLGLSRKFAHFGEDAASGKSKAFKQFTDFSTSVAPQVKTDLGDIGKLTGGALTGLAPAVKPSLTLIDDVVKGISPIIGPLESKLPGIITNIDNMVTKVSPLASDLAGPFSEGVATTIGDVAKAIGDVSGWLDQIPEPILKNIGTDIGVLVAAATISKLTGLSKVPGILKGIYGAFPKKGTKDPLDGMGGKFKDMGDKASGAAGGLDKFTGAKGREKAALGGNDDLLDSNATAMGKFGDEAEAAGRKVSKLPGLAKGLFTLGAGAAIPALSMTVHDDTAPGVKSAKDRINSVKPKAVPITALDLMQPGVRSATESLGRVHGKTVNLGANNNTGMTVKNANQTVSQFHGKNVNLTAGGLTGIRNTYSQAQGTVNQFHGKSVLLVASGAGIAGQVSAAQILINALHGKNVTNTVTTNYVEHHSGGGKSSTPKGLFAPGSGLKKPKNSGNDLFNLPGITVPGGVKLPLPGELVPVGATGGKFGKISGPGTGTSDSIPAMLSNEEWVIKAGRARQLGDNFMNWVNYGAGVNPPGFLRLYRDGGQVQHLASGGKAATPKPQYIYATTAATRATAAKQRSNLQATGEKLLASILAGMVGGASASKIASTATSVISKIDSAFTGSRRSSLVKFVQGENRQLQGLAKERDALKVKLSTYNDARTSAVQAATSFGAVTTLPTGTGSGNLVAGLRIKLGDIKTFSKNLKTLAKRGLNARALNQIIAAGPDQGAAYAAELVAGTNANIKSVSSLTNQISLASRQFGTLAANSEVGGNIAKDFVAGIVSREGRLSDAMTRAARAFAKQLQLDFNRQASSIKAKTVKVKVPVKATKHDTGGYLPEGLSVNLNQTGRPEPVLNPAQEGALFAATRSVPIDYDKLAGTIVYAASTMRKGPIIGQVDVHNDTDVDAMGQRLALIMRTVS